MTLDDEMILALGSVVALPPFDGSTELVNSIWDILAAGNLKHGDDEQSAITHTAHAHAHLHAEGDDTDSGRACGSEAASGAFGSIKRRREMSAYQRRKGHNYEREVAAQLREIFPGARRGLQYQDGAGVSDVVNCGPFHLECKRGAKPNPRAALAQAINDAAEGMVPLCVIKDDRCEPFAVMRWADLLDFIAEWRERGEK